MSRNIMDALNRVPDGTQPKNGFDLSSFETFTQKGGMLNVVGVRDTVPNSDYRMSVDGFTRSLPCNTANFAHIKENYYFVHVPLGLVNRNAYQMLVQRKQPYSALDMGVTCFPYFDLSLVVSRLFEIQALDVTKTENKKFVDVHGFNIAFGAFRLLDMLGYGSFVDISEALQAGLINVSQAQTAVRGITLRPTANRLAAYQMIWYYFFRNDVFDNSVSPKCFNFDDVTYKSTADTEPNYNIISVRGLDNFIVDCLQMRYVGYKKDLYSAFMPGTQYGPVSTVSVNAEISDLTARFVGDTITPTGSVSSTIDNDNVNIYGINGYYVQSSLDGSSSDVITASLQNGSSANLEYQTPGFSGDTDTTVGFARYADNPSLDGTFIDLGPQGTAPLQHTHRVNGYVGLQADVIASKLSTNIPSSTVAAGLQGVLGSDSVSSTLNLNPLTPTGQVILNGTGGSSASLFDVLQLVEAQAIQKWRQKSMLAGNKTADQFRAHHGEVPKHLIDHLPDFIGSVDNEIQITEITSTADTATDADSTNLGEIAGRGYGASENKTFKFHSDDYGILFLLHAIVPENTYSSFGLDTGNTRVYYNDFYQSEFTNLGLQAIPNYTLNVTDYVGKNDNPDNTGADGLVRVNQGIIGYAPRDFGYKTYPSKVHGLFNPTRLYVGDESKPVPTLSPFGYNDMQSFALVRRDLTVPIRIVNGVDVPGTIVYTLSNLYVHPAIFDSIFNVAADVSQTTDEFISHCRFGCEASLPMPILGLPQF